MIPRRPSFSRPFLFFYLLCFQQLVLAYVPRATVSSTVLVFARDQSSAENGATAGLRGYGIPFETVIVPQSGISSLPPLNSSSSHGNYGGIIIISEVGYTYDTQYYSALTTKQWATLYNYQTQFGVRMVRLDVYPSAEFGVSSAGASVSDEVVSFTNTTGFETAGLKTNAGVSITGFFHYPATITNSSIAWEVARFTKSGSVAAIVNKANSRQQMIWFMPSALDWAPSSNFLQHAWITWVTRGIYIGFRRAYLSTQVDDMFLESTIYKPEGSKYRVKPEDLSLHVQWQAELNGRLPKGSEFFLEIGHNGNGDIAAAVDTADGKTLCRPNVGIERLNEVAVDPEYVKPLGTGTDAWPSTPSSYTWSLECAETDELQNWFAEEANRDAFAHVSHTFSHEILTNATYSDASKEITFNQAWADQVGLSAAKRWSPKGIIPPAITGLHNGDAIKAWLDNGIANVVGDNTRPSLRNSQNTFWPVKTTVAENGYAGINIIPRWATLIYYNCDLPDCTLQEWIDTSGGTGPFSNLIDQARSTAIRNLMGLHWDPYMFHQANMRVQDVPNTSVGGKTGKFSLLMTWTEVVTAELIRLTSWPIKTLKHDDIAQAFLNRQSRDMCRPSMTWTSSVTGNEIESINIYTAGGNKCGTTIPVTVPIPVLSTTGATKEQIGSDPLTLWVTMAGASRQYAFSKGIAL